MAERDLHSHGLGVDNHHEDEDRRDDREQRALSQKELLDPLCGEQIGELGRPEDDREPRRDDPRIAGQPAPGEHSPEEALAHAGDDEQADPAADAPLRDDLVQKQDEDTADEHLRKDEQLDRRLAVRGGEFGTRRKEATQKHHRKRGQGGHGNHQQLLEALIEHLIARIVGVESQEASATKQLHDDAGGDDRADPHLEDRSLFAGEDRAELPEDVFAGSLGGEAPEEDVREEKVHEQHTEGPGHLAFERDVSLGAGDARHSSENRFRGFLPAH